MKYTFEKCESLSEKQRAYMNPCTGSGMYNWSADERVLWATISELETALAAMTAERDARDVAIGVLGQAIANVKSTTDWPELTNTMQAGLFCGVEDRDLRDRYDGARYGYEDALERCEEFIRNAVSAVDANHLARAAVEGER